MPTLICFDCHLRRNKMASPVYAPLPAEKGERPKVKIVGWVCKKCYQKRKVMQRPAGVGWRTAWRHLFYSIKNQQPKDVPTKGTEFKKL
jgi:hypothetical protein